MAAGAIVNVGDAFFTVFGDDLGWLVFVAAEASVALVVAVWMAGCTADVVRAVQFEIAIMDEGGGFPERRLMARAAGKVLAAMQIICRGLVTGLTLGTRFGLKQRVIEASGFPFEEQHSRVVAVTVHAIGFDQRLMKRGTCCCPRNPDPLGGAKADIRDFVADGTTIG